MPEQMTKEEILGLAALLAASGGLVIWTALSGKQGAPGLPPGTHYDALGTQYPIVPLLPGETIQAIRTPSFDSGPIRVTLGQPVVAARPQAVYQGPGRDAYTYCRVLQQGIAGSQWVTVYGSGIAGFHLPASATPTPLDLVNPAQPQPPGCGCPTQGLCAYPWTQTINPCISSTGICGAPAVLGRPTILAIEIYEKKYPADADGYSSPTCYVVNGQRRMPVFRQLWQNFAFV